MRRRRSRSTYRVPGFLRRSGTPGYATLNNIAKNAAASAVRRMKGRGMPKKKKNMMFLALAAVVFLFWGKIKALFVKA